MNKTNDITCLRGKRGGGNTNQYTFHASMTHLHMLQWATLATLLRQADVCLCLLDPLETADCCLTLVTLHLFAVNLLKFHLTAFILKSNFYYTVVYSWYIFIIHWLSIQENLTQLAKEKAGSPMLYDLIEVIDLIVVKGEHRWRLWACCEYHWIPS